MSKADELAKMKGHMKESIGAGGGASARPTPQPRARNPREVGLARANDAFDIETAQLVRDEEQPRKEFDEDLLDKLGHSLKTRGQLQAILVRYSPAQEKWVVVDGERRWRAATRVGLSKLKAIETTKTDSVEIFTDQVVANMLRADLKPVEQARAYERIMEENGWTTTRLGAELGISQGAISQAMALLKLPEDAQAKVDDGTISPTIGYEIAKIKDDEVRDQVVAQVVEQKATDEPMTRDEVREVAREANAGAKKVASPRGRKATGRPTKPVQDWKDKIEGFQVQVARKRGWDWVGAAAALRSAADRIEAEHGKRTA